MTSPTRDDCTCIVDVVAHDVASDCPLHHVEPYMSTPPADTRQQAAEAAAELRATIVEMMSWAETMDLGRVGAEWADNKLAEYEVAAALASSPALPEPPAPTVAGGLASWESPHSTVFVCQGVVRAYPRTLTPAEARLLASTLLAAADVAEEQQP